MVKSFQFLGLNITFWVLFSCRAWKYGPPILYKKYLNCATPKYSIEDPRVPGKELAEGFNDLLGNLAWITLVWERHVLCHRHPEFNTVKKFPQISNEPGVLATHWSFFSTDRGCICCLFACYQNFSNGGNSSSYDSAYGHVLCRESSS